MRSTYIRELHLETSNIPLASDASMDLAQPPAGPLTLTNTALMAPLRLALATAHAAAEDVEIQQPVFLPVGPVVTRLSAIYVVISSAQTVTHTLHASQANVRAMLKLMEVIVNVALDL